MKLTVSIINNRYVNDDVQFWLFYVTAGVAADSKQTPSIVSFIVTYCDFVVYYSLTSLTQK